MENATVDASRDSLGANAATIAVPALGLAIVQIRDFGTGPVLACYALGLAGVLYCAWLAARGSDRQVIWTPITGVVLSAVLAWLGETKSPVAPALSAAIFAVALGVPVMAVVLKGRNAKLIMAAGLVAGCLGFLLFAAAVDHHLPVFTWYVPLDRLFTIDPFHIGFFKTDTLGGLQFNGGILWPLFVLQTVVVAAWDALLIAVCVALVGGIASLPIRLFVRD